MKIEKALFWETAKVRDVEGIAKMLQDVLPSLGYKPIPSPGVIALHDGIDNRTYYFESGRSGCYYEFDLKNGEYHAAIKFKKFPEAHYEGVLQRVSQKFPQFFLDYASK